MLMANLGSIKVILFPSPQFPQFWLLEILRSFNRLPETKNALFILSNKLQQ